MATLPTVSSLTGATTTNAQQKTNFTDLRNFLSDLLGTDSSNKAAARAALSIPYTPAGTFIQGGTATTNGSGSVTVTFPVQFPNGVVRVTASPIVASFGSYGVNVTARSAGGFSANITLNNVGVAGLNIDWIAFGN